MGRWECRPCWALIPSPVLSSGAHTNARDARPIGGKCSVIEWFFGFRQAHEAIYVKQ